jgi:hypothetical protein
MGSSKNRTLAESKDEGIRLIIPFRRKKGGTLMLYCRFHQKKHTRYSAPKWRGLVSTDLLFLAGGSDF